MQKSKYINSYRKKDILSLIFFIIFYFIIWSVYILGLQPYLKNNYLLFFKIFHLGFEKLTFMIIPVFYYLKYYIEVNPITFLKLNTNIKKNGVKYIIIATIFLFVIHFSQYHHYWNNIKFDPFFSIYTWVNSVIMAAFIDEIVFRGIVLQKINQYISFEKANFISALLFLLIHFPIWIKYGYFASFASINFVFGFGLVSGYILKKSGSLWPCIIIHSINNFLMSALHF